MGGSTGIGIFVSYRREDTAGYAGRLHEALTERFGPGRVFMDLHSIEPGTDFVTATDAALAQCRVVLALIGPRWLTVTTETGARRLDEPDDYVRRELEIAFDRDLYVIPLLLQGATMPHEAQLPASLARLARCQALELSDRRWRESIAELTDILHRTLDHNARAISSRPDETDVAAITVPFPSELRYHDVFVGRDDALTQLDDAWQSAVAGHGRGVFVAGEPGIGKTRLVAEYAGRVHLEGAIVLYGRCDEDLGVAYQPFTEAIRHYVRACRAPHLRIYEREVLAQLVRLLPELATLVPELPAALQADPDTERYELFEAIRRFLAAMSRSVPVVLVLDDLHWAAKPTLLLLRHILRATDAMRVLTVATFRDTELTGTSLTAMLPELRSVAAVRQISLSGLTRDDITAYVEATDQGGEHSSTLAQRLWTDTEGQPLFVRELLEEGLGYGEHSDNDTKMPPRIRDVIERRVTKLSMTTQQVLAAAAVAGPTVSVRFLERLDAVNSAQLLDAIDEAIRAGVLTDRNEPGSVTFSHALIRDAVYSDLTAVRRAHLHQHIAHSLESLAPVADDDERLPALAYHFAQAAVIGDTDPAANYAHRAARQALNCLAYEDAINHIDRGLHALEHAPHPDHRRRAMLLLALAEAHKFVGNRAGALDAARRAANQARTVDAELFAAAAVCYADWPRWGQRDPFALALLDEALERLGEAPSVSRANLLGVLAARQMLDGDSRAAVINAEEAVHVARAYDDPVAIWGALWGLNISLEGLPDIPRRLAVTQELVRLGRELDDAGLYLPALENEQYAQAEIGNLSGFPEYLELFAGEVERVRRRESRFKRSRELAPQGFDFWELHLFTIRDRIFYALLNGDWARAEAIVTRASSDASVDANFRFMFAAQIMHLRREQGRAREVFFATQAAAASSPDFPVMRAAAAMLALDIGDRTTAEQHLATLTDNGLDKARQGFTSTGTLAMLTETSVGLRDVRPAATLHALFTPFSGYVVILATLVTCMGAVDRYLGMLETVLERWNDAEQHFESALALERRLDSPPLVARTEYWYGAMLLERDQAGDRTRARDLLSSGLRTASDLGMALLAEQATAKLGTTE